MRRYRMLAFVVAGFLVAPSVWAQTTTGVIRGVVTDDSGGVLPGVTVTLKGPATAGTPTTTTNETGVYRFPNLAPGAYQITAGAHRVQHQHADRHPSGPWRHRPRSAFNSSSVTSKRP